MTAKRTGVDDLLTAKDLAEMLHRPLQAIYDMRHRGTGPRAIRPAGGKLLFRRSDVEAWLKQYEDPAGDAGAA